MRIVRAAVLIAAVFGASAASAACSVSQLAQLPVTMSGLQPTIHAKIEGHDVRLMVDSGAFFSLLSPAVGKGLKLQMRALPFGYAIEGVGGSTQPELTRVENFTLDAIRLKQVEFLVGGSEIGEGLSGVVGRNILNLSDTEYDLANGVVRLMKATGCDGVGLAYWSGGKNFSTAPILSDEDRKTPIVINVAVNGVRLKALMDTGASGSSINIDAAKRAGISVSGTGVTTAGATGGIGRRLVRSFSAPVADIRIGDEDIKNTRLEVLSETSDNREFEMLLGADFFLSHRVFVARSQKVVYFTYNGGPVFNLIAKPLDAREPGDASPGVASASEPAKPGAEPIDAAGLSRRGEAAAGRRDYPAALADLDRAVALEPANPDFVFQRAKIRLANGQVFLAMADVEQTLKLRPNDTDALLTRAQLRFMGRDRDAGLADLDAVARSEPATSDVRLRLAKLYEQADRLAQAVTQYDLWIAVHPDDNRLASTLNARCWLGGLLDQDLEKALGACDAAHRLMPKSAAFLDSRGLVELRLGHLAKAIADYSAALAIDPKLAWSLYGRGLAKSRSGDTVGGKADLEAASKIDPKIGGEAAKYGLNPPPAP